MLADSQTYLICSQKFKGIVQAVSEKYGNEHCDTKILYKISESIEIVEIEKFLTNFEPLLQKNPEFQQFITLPFKICQ